VADASWAFRDEDLRVQLFHARMMERQSATDASLEPLLRDDANIEGCKGRKVD